MDDSMLLALLLAGAGLLGSIITKLIDWLLGSGGRRSGREKALQDKIALLWTRIETLEKEVSAWKERYTLLDQDSTSRYKRLDGDYQDVVRQLQQLTILQSGHDELLRRYGAIQAEIAILQAQAVVAKTAVAHTAEAAADALKVAQNGG